MSICESIAKATRWECISSGDNAVRVFAPFSFAIDGQCIGFYVCQRYDNKFFITDGGDTAMLISSHGADVTLQKLRGVLNRSEISTVKILESGEIAGVCEAKDLSFFLWDAALLAYRISIQSQSWLPKLNQVRFEQLVREVVTKKVGNNRIIVKPKTKGVSGHSIQFPFAVRSVSNDFYYYIEPVPANEHGILDWSVVHRTYGKLSDEKESDSINRRVVVLDDDVTDKEISKASTILANVATIIQPKYIMADKDLFAA